MGVLARLVEPDVERHLLTIEGEIIVDQVHKHWVASVGWYALAAASIPLFMLMIPAAEVFWFPMVLGLLALAVGAWRIHALYMDRFVITNMRVFRVNGVFTQNTATMPMSRILDISMTQPLLGQICGYGHFVFETAAQDQGLREIRFVGRPEQRDLTIQRIIQRAGLRQKMSAEVVREEEGWPLT
ncbi:MAG: PH domain-containing protein [Arachnia sp.]